MLPLAITFARREFRAGLKGFRIFMACLALGVAAIAGVGSLAASIEAGLRADGRVLLGGDISFRLTHQPITAEQRDWLSARSERMDEIVEMRGNAFAIDTGARRLVELKAVDGAYPLFGGLVLTGETDITKALERRDGIWGAAAQPALLERLELKLGDRLRIGDLEVELRSAIEREPDRGTSAFDFGPRLMIATGALEQTGLVRLGSVINYSYRLDLPDTVSPVQFREAVNQAFPDAGWRIRDLENAAPNIQRFVDRVGLFMTLVGLTALLVGGVGVGNAVRSFLQGKVATIATFKCLGAPARLIFMTYMIQVGAIALIGIAIGLALGILAPIGAIAFLGDRLPVEARYGLYWQPLALALLFGVLTTLVFSLWPLARAQAVPAATLFRNLFAPVTGFPGWRATIAVALLAAILAMVAVVTAADSWLAARFVGGAVAALVAFWLVALLVMRLSKTAPRARNMRLRLAIANLHRPGSATAGIIMSLGLGLTVLVAVALIEGNLNRQLNETLRGETPGYFFIDIQPEQIPVFKQIAANFQVPVRVETTPMLRGRITALKGVPISEIDVPPDEAWILRGDRGITWTAGGPPDPKLITRGDWWPADYSGPTLVSFDAEAAEAFGLEIGDTITVNVLGRNIEARIANWRHIDWNTLGINFVMIFSPGVLSSAPQTSIATAYLDPSYEVAFEKAVIDALPNISAIRVKEVLQGVSEILVNLGLAVRAIAFVAIIAGVLVLAGAIAAGHSRRVYDSVVLKVLGATRRDVIGAYALEYGVLGLATAGIASLIGAAGAWFVITRLMQADWIFVGSAVFITVLVALVCTVGAGMFGTFAALSRKAAPLLRNE